MTSFLQLSHPGFHFNWPIKMRELQGGRVDKLHVGFPAIVNPASHSNLYFDWPVSKEALRKLSQKCQKVVTNYSETLSTGNSTVGQISNKSCIHEVFILVQMVST